MRALLVEDEEKLLTVIAKALKAEGFAVDTASSGARGLELSFTYNYDVVILDIMLPHVTGSDILRKLRADGRQMPILILTARDSVADKVTHLDVGADDYLTKPFSMEELLGRVRALLRRTPVQRLDVIKVGDLEIDRLGHQVKRGGKRIELSAKEYALLEYLAVNKGRILSRPMIIEHVWDQSFEALTNIVDVYIRQLRTKIDEGFDKKLIKTMRGMGYGLQEPAQ